MKLNHLLQELSNKTDTLIIGSPSSNASTTQILFYDARLAEAELPNTLFLLEDSAILPENSQSYFLSITTNKKQKPQSPQHLLLVTNKPVSLDSIFSQLQKILEQEQTLFRHFRDLYTIASQHSPITTFLKRVQQLIGQPIFIANTHFSIIGDVQLLQLPDTLLEKQDTHHAIHSKLIQKIKQAPEFHSLQKGQEAALSIPLEENHHFILAGIFTGSYLVGYLGMVTADSQPNSYDFQLAHYIAELAGHNIYTVPIQQNLTGEQIGDSHFLTFLLSHANQLEELSVLWGWKKYLHHDSYQLLVCSTPQQVEAQAKFHFFHILQKIFPHSPLLQMGDQCLILLYGKQKQSLLSEQQLLLLTEQLSILKQEAILSFPFTSIEQTAFYYSYSSQLLQEQQINSQHTIATMEQLYLSFLRMTYSSKEPIELLLHPDLKQLKKHDQQYNSSLYDTLITYLTCNRNILQMSQTLHISKSTGFYRMNQIKDLLNNPFEDSQRLFCYECIIRLL